MGPLASAVLGHALQPAKLGPVEAGVALGGAGGSEASHGNGGVTVEANTNKVGVSNTTMEASEVGAVTGQWWQQYYSSQEERQEQGRSEALWGRWVGAVPSSLQGGSTVQYSTVQYS